MVSHELLCNLDIERAVLQPGVARVVFQSGVARVSLQGVALHAFRTRRQNPPQSWVSTERPGEKEKLTGRRFRKYRKALQENAAGRSFYAVFCAFRCLLWYLGGNPRLWSITPEVGSGCAVGPCWWLIVYPRGQLGGLRSGRSSGGLDLNAGWAGKTSNRSLI